MADVDAEAVADWLRTWGIEAGGGLLAVAGASAAVGGDNTLAAAVALGLLLALGDRVRLRLDNRSLAAFAREVRSRRRENDDEREPAAPIGAAGSDETGR